ncbi:flagellar basal body P-ring biosynthesis protein-like protein [Thiohalobacter thiocyanaticus]|uniref:Flagella basal body P-ring formation protein FlgA n=1 Tax=Thiohalobacter thiocyanaticus TaxID=585455 RepID=A0A1Z4VQT5_9GAMM|nr:flagellar basal body P-ring biosynthesis protein-like protein [Thiohalobacter thiocyanaticus]
MSLVGFRHSNCIVQEQLRFDTQERQVKAGAWILMIALGLGQTVGAAPAGFQSHQGIVETAQRFLAEQAAAAHSGKVEASIGRLDSRLRLKRCGAPLEAFLPAGARLSGNTSVGVRCPGPTEWKIYVSGKISVFGQVVVASEPLLRGEAVGEAQLRVVERELSGLSYGYFDRTDKLTGMLAGRAIPAGTVITPNMLSAPRLINRGDRVTLLTGSERFQVRMRGEAMSDGTRGERIRVKALNSQRVIEGWVVSRGVVKVTL